MIKAKKFQEYDYGKLANLKIYGTCIPPEIDISLGNESEVPVALIEGMDDKLINYMDARWIVDALKPSLVDYQEIPGGHMVYLVGNSDYFTKYVLKYLNKYNV